MSKNVTSDDIVWYAECESNHPLWDGPDRANSQKAQADADDHDRKIHEGARTASVLSKSANNRPDFITLERHLSNQKSSFIQAVVSEIAGSDEVKITPWFSEQACLCKHAFTLPKPAIKSVRPRGMVNCCGKSRELVDIFFDNDFNLPMKDTLSKLISLAKKCISEEKHPPLSTTTYNKSSDKVLRITRNHIVLPLDSGDNPILPPFKIPSLGPPGDWLPTDEWDKIDVVTCEGAHDHADRDYAEHDYDVTINNPKLTFEYNQEVIKQEDDTYFTFTKVNPQHIRWSLFAQNCTFSCSEIWIRIMYRVVPL
jgi:hypothetical protein